MTFFNLGVLWASLGCLFIFVEYWKPGFWWGSIGISFLMAGLVFYYKLDLVGQIFIFSITLFLLLFIVKPFYTNLIKNSKARRSNKENIIGTKGVISMPILGKNKIGEVAIFNKIWKACSEDGEPIEKGTQVLVVGNQGFLLYVKRYEKENLRRSV